MYELSVVLENDQCSDAISQFYCNAVDTVNNHSHNLITECLEVRDDICAAEWRMVESFLDFTLPSCNNFYGSKNFTSEKAPALSCPAGFDIFCGSLCQPLCDEFSLFSDVATVAYRVLNVMFHVVAIIAGVVTILACCVHRTKMYANTCNIYVWQISLCRYIGSYIVDLSLLCRHNIENNRLQIWQE